LIHGLQQQECWLCLVCSLDLKSLDARTSKIWQTHIASFKPFMIGNIKPVCPVNSLYSTHEV